MQNRLRLIELALHLDHINVMTFEQMFFFVSTPVEGTVTIFTFVLFHFAMN